MQADERSARQNNRFSGSVCRGSLTITMQLIEDFIGPARLLFKGQKYLKKKILSKKKIFFFLFLFSRSCLFTMKLCLAHSVHPLIYRRVLEIVRIQRAHPVYAHSNKELILSLNSLVSIELFIRLLYMRLQYTNLYWFFIAGQQIQT